MIWVFLIMVVVAALASRFFYVRGFTSGHAEGRVAEAEYWEKLKRTPIAGQAILVPAFGEVIILGRGEIGGVAHIDYILSDVVNGRNIPDIDGEELERNTISCPLDEFIAQCEISLKFL
jgi:hypothetical protein